MSKTLGQAILHCSCPRCGEGKMFKSNPAKNWFGLKMHDKCEVCQQTFEPEPGFYYGAMFISYGFSVAITLTTGMVLFFLFNDPDFWVYITAVSTAVIVMFPLMYRYSRSIFLHLFGGIRFDSKYTK